MPKYKITKLITLKVVYHIDGGDAPMERDMDHTVYPNEFDEFLGVVNMQTIDVQLILED